MSIDPEEMHDTAAQTTLHQVRVLDGALQRLRQRAEEDMPIEIYSHLLCTMERLEVQLLQYLHALLHWAEHEHEGSPFDEHDEE